MATEAELRERQYEDALVVQDYLVGKGWDVRILEEDPVVLELEIIDPRLEARTVPARTERWRPGVVGYVENSTHQVLPLVWSLEVRSAPSPEDPDTFVHPRSRAAERIIALRGIFAVIEKFEELVAQRELWVYGPGEHRGTVVAEWYRIRPIGQTYEAGDRASVLLQEWEPEGCPDDDERYVAVRIDESRYLEDTDAGREILARAEKLYAIYIVDPTSRVHVASLTPSSELHLVDYVPAQWEAREGQTEEEAFEEWDALRQEFLSTSEPVDYMNFSDLQRRLGKRSNFEDLGCFENVDDAIEYYQGNPRFNNPKTKRVKKLKARLLR